MNTDFGTIEMAILQGGDDRQVAERLRIDSRYVQKCVARSAISTDRAAGYSRLGVSG